MLRASLGGIPVRDSGLTAVVNHGNLVLLGLQSWDEAGRPGVAAIGEAAARAAVQRHAEPFVVESFADGARLEYVPVAALEAYEYRLVWAVTARLRSDVGTWEGLVDAASGELMAFEDTNAYAQRRAIGGVYPLSNDQRPPDGVEQEGWPMPFLDLTLPSGSVTTTTGGTFACSPAGVATTALTGPFARIVDGCGPINETSAGDLDLGASGGTHCVVPAGHSAGDTHAARTAYYEINRAAEQARGWLPGNAWLQTQLTVATNQAGCNAFWNGMSLSFSGPTCTVNLGEIASFITHEWGHGLDDNGVNGSMSSPLESLADVHAAVRHARSCMGRGMNTAAVCSGLRRRVRRDARHRVHRPPRHRLRAAPLQPAPHDHVDPVGVHRPCSAPAARRRARWELPGRAAGWPIAKAWSPRRRCWDLYKRDLQAPPFSLDANTALEITTRLAFLGSQVLTSWYTCAVGGAAAPAADTCSSSPPTTTTAASPTARRTRAPSGPPSSATRSTATRPRPRTRLRRRPHRRPRGGRPASATERSPSAGARCRTRRATTCSAPRA